MSNFLVLTNDYHKTDIALYIDATQKAFVSDDARYSSKYLIPMIKELLEKNHIHINPLILSDSTKLHRAKTNCIEGNDLDFIAVNQGPGKFTSLRVLLATANGLSFATHLPLIGIDGITTLLDEAHKNGVTVALLNAFNNDAFYGVAHDNEAYETGYKNIEALLNELKEWFDEKITFIGEGVSLFKDQIQAILGKQAIIPSDYPKSASLDFIAQTALKKFKEGKTANQLMPLYLKKPHYKKAL